MKVGIDSLVAIGTFPSLPALIATLITSPDYNESLNRMT